jgi:dolichol-phosphate mannosyltransferase
MKHYFWRETTKEIEQVVEEVRHQSGQNPIVVGMSKWSVASVLSYYKRSGNEMDIRSRNMFGGSGAMYDFWSPSQSPSIRPIILVSMNRNQLERDQLGNDLGQMLDQPGPIQYRTIMRNNKQLRGVYYRIAQGYLGKVN